MEEHLYCYTPEEMAAFVEGGAEPRSKAVFENHILECADCRREWIEISLARNLPAEQPPREVQNAIKAAPAKVDAPYVKRYAPVAERSYTGSRIAALIAAVALVAVVIMLVSSINAPEPVRPPEHSAVVPESKPLLPEEEDPQEKLVQPPKERKVKGLPVPAPEEEVKVVEEREPEVQEKVVKAGPAVPEKEPEVEVPEERVVKRTGPRSVLDPADAEKKAGPGPKPDAAGEKLALKLARDDADIFRKHYRHALMSAKTQEQELIKQAKQQAKKYDPIMGRPPTGVPTPTTPKPAPGAEPKQDPAPNPNAPAPLPRIDKLRKEGKLPPEEDPSAQPKEPEGNPNTPAPLPRIDKLRKEGKLPPEKTDDPKSDPKEEPKEDPKADPKPEPKKGEEDPRAPSQPDPAAPAKRGLAQVPEVSPEELKKAGKEAGIEPVCVPGLKKGVLLALAAVVEDSTKNKVLHLFYYFGSGGFSVFERKTARIDKKKSYQVHYNGKGKTRSLMWAAGGREFILVAQKLSKRQMYAIEASVRDLLK